jgi:hypothetical protein
MTTLISWVGVDNRGAASLYFASDSRISWPGAEIWDHGRKLFACRRYPCSAKTSSFWFLPTFSCLHFLKSIFVMQTAQDRVPYHSVTTQNSVTGDFQHRNAS